MVAFISEANKEIGFGHLYRSIALAQHFEKEGEKICFYIKSATEEELIRNFLSDPLIRDQTTIFEPQRPLNEDIELLFVDVYHQHFEQFDNLKKIDVKIVTIVDAAFENSALKLDYVFKIGFQDYQRKHEAVSTNRGKTHEYSGRDFFIFRNEFSKNLNYSCREEVSNIFLSMGGSDPHHLTELVLEVLDDIPEDFQITLVVGSGFSEERFEPLLEKYRQADHKLMIHRNVSNMAEVMSKADLAIINGGNTRFELAAIGVPFTSIAINEKQKMISKAVENAGIGIELGVYVNLKKEDISKEIGQLINDQEKRKKMSLKMRSLIAPKGAERIVSILKEENAF